jgi:basic membrane lipoprotein Med (substrate-binding protein (PBP1-ABC) superfamily)
LVLFQHLLHRLIDHSLKYFVFLDIGGGGSKGWNTAVYNSRQMAGKEEKKERGEEARPTRGIPRSSDKTFINDTYLA